MDSLVFEHGGNIHQMEKKHKRKFIDFSANINPLGLPLNTKITLFKNFQKIFHYPDMAAENIRSKIAQYWQIEKENVLIGNGSVDLIYLLLNALKPKRVLIPCPTFSEYERAAQCSGSQISFIRLREEEDFQLKYLRPDCADVLFICNPNNPTGNLMFQGQNILRDLESKLIIIDEAFMDFLFNEKKYSFINIVQNDRRVVVLRSFTKFFALAGLRIGYLVAHQDVVKKLQHYQVPWSVNCPAQLAAELIITDREYRRKTRQFVEKERNFLFNEIAKLKKLTPYPSVTNFLLIKINDDECTSSLLRQRLIQKGMLIRDCANFRGLGNKFVRIALRLHSENLKLVKILKEVV